ncbi:MAG: polysaccharide biosynthesis/export family protein [Hyphomicrobium sp.]|nr:polysaccharide biosynthesis/export family protein [Hyphomicrobium sp.]
MRSASILLASRALPCLALVFAVTGCSDGPTLPSSALSADGPAALGSSYKIGIGDKLKISVFGEESLSGQVEVDPAGRVALPLAGEVQAHGKTIAEFRESVTRRLSDGYLKSPKVNVEIANFRPIYVHGEVRSGGEFPYKTAITLRDAVAMAGGYTYRANQGYVLIVRGGQPEARVAAEGNMAVLPGDNIRIPERFF